MSTYMVSLIYEVIVYTIDVGKQMLKLLVFIFAEMIHRLIYYWFVLIIHTGKINYFYYLMTVIVILKRYINSNKTLVERAPPLK